VCQLRHTCCLYWLAKQAYWSSNKGTSAFALSHTQSWLNQADSIGCMHTYITPLSHARRFYSKLDILLNEDVLIGKSRACQETLRPPAASTLAELIVHVRSELTLQQIQRIVYMFSRQALAETGIATGLSNLWSTLKACIQQMMHCLHDFGLTIATCMQYDMPSASPWGMHATQAHLAVMWPALQQQPMHCESMPIQCQPFKKLYKHT